jgi:cation diffusion facilitator CzcD-associated flavoprotein CzcO
MNVVLPMEHEARLARLAERVQEEWRRFDFATKPWIKPRFRDGQRLTDVVLIGGGQSGLVLSTALRRHGVRDLVVLDRAEEGLEGPWHTFARMHELRSPKEVTGAECGLPSLGIQAWYEARHGRDAWAALERVPREDWAAWLLWYRRAVDAPVRNGVEVTDIVPEDDAVRLLLRTADGDETMLARTVVLATGMDGGGAWRTPDFIANALPRHLYWHSSEAIDVASLSGLRLGVLGIGAAGFDISCAALAAGAAAVEMHMRRAKLPMLDMVRELETAGLLEHFPEAPDAMKWAFSGLNRQRSQSPPLRAFAEATAWPNFRLRAGSPWLSVRAVDGVVEVETPHGRHRYDRVVAATGAIAQMDARPELRSLAPRVLRWADRFTPPADDPAPDRLRAPYLLPTYQFQPRDVADAGVGRIFAFNQLAAPSMGPLAAVSISCHRFGVPRLVRGITGLLWREQQDGVIADLAAYAEPGIVVPPAVQAMLAESG